MHLFGYRFASSFKLSTKAQRTVCLYFLLIISLPLGGSRISCDELFGLTDLKDF